MKIKKIALFIVLVIMGIMTASVSADYEYKISFSGNQLTVSEESDYSGDKELYVAVYHDEKLLEVHQTDITDDVFEFNSGVSGDELKAFVFGEKMKPLSTAANGTLGDNRTVTVIIEHNPSYVNTGNSFAVVDSVNEGILNDAERYYFDLYTADSDGEIVSLFVDDDEIGLEPDDFRRGDVISCVVTSDNTIKNIVKVFGVKSLDTDLDDAISYSEAVSFLNSVEYTDSPLSWYADDWFFKSGVDMWDESVLSSPGGYVRVGFGAVVGRTSYDVTFAHIRNASGTVYGEDGDVIAVMGDIISYGEDIQTIDLDSDINVYVYDFNERDRPGLRISAGVVGDIAKTLIPPSQISTYIDGSDAYNWSEINSVEHANYAFFKTVDGAITDILVIIAPEY